MSGKLRLNGATSGYSELQAPDVAGDQTFTLPAVGGTLSTVGYQQGTIPVALALGTVTPGLTAEWYRIGNFVFLTANVAEISNKTSSDYVDCTSIPYGSVVPRAAGSLMCVDCGQAWTTSFINDTVIRFYLSNPGTGSYTLMRHSDLGPGASFYFTATYQTDDTTWQPINGATIS